MSSDENIAKKAMRMRIEQRRAARSAPVREKASADLARWVSAAPFRLESDVTVAAYVPFGTEPGSPLFLDALTDRGVTVLLPVVPAGTACRLDWARYDGPDSLVPGRWGLPHPTGALLGPDAVRSASVIFVPAYAVDTTGTRLGRGAGYYDRTLIDTNAELVAVVYEDEVFDEPLPCEDHDIAVRWVLTPTGGFQQLR